MAFVLPPLPQAPLDSPFGSSIYMRSCSSIADDVTVRRYNVRTPSPASFITASSQPASGFAGRKENSPLVSGSGSATSLVNVRLFDTSKLNNPPSPRSSWSWTVPSDHLENSTFDLISRFQIHLENTESEYFSSQGPVGDAETCAKVKTAEGSQDRFQLDHVLENEEPSVSKSVPRTPKRDSLDDDSNITKSKQPSPFKRWLKALKKRHMRQPEANYPHVSQWSDASLLTAAQLEMSQSTHKKTPSSIASTTFITAVKTASMTMTSLSLYPRSRRSVQTSHLHKESSQKDQPCRSSFDSIGPSVTLLIDDGTCSRSLHRHRIVEEMVSSEESYVRDLKTLLNVYLAVLPKNGCDRRIIQRTVSQILLLHEDLISQLQGILWDDNYHSVLQSRSQRMISRHVRWHSMETSPPRSNIRFRRERFNRHSIDTSQPSLIRPKPFMADTKLALDVAKIFDNFVNRFLVYEAYAAYNNLMRESLVALREFNRWNETEKGIEALSTLINSIENREADRNKALAFSDLAVKPIQRICKYPLFFRDLCKYTPACDDPVAHSDLQRVLVRLEETAEEINRAMCNLEVRRRVEISWLLQNRFRFEDQALDKPDLFRKLGHVILCGALHVVYPGNTEIKGQYLICTLYRSALILASAVKSSHIYHVFLCIPLLNASIDVADSGKGLQCHNAQFTWKLVIDINRRQHKMLMSACSEAEESVWKRNLRARITTENMEHTEGRSVVTLPFYVHPDFKSTGPSYGPFLNFSRRLSIQRAATLGAKSAVQQVIIKNTEAPRYSDNSANNAFASPSCSSGTVMRSQSHNSPVHVPTLAPKRSERVKLENNLTDVWTKFVIPYPGMGGKLRGESVIRASANSVMRKLSMASIASNFSKRSMSQATITTIPSSTTVTTSRPEMDMYPAAKLLHGLKGSKKLQQEKEPPHPILVDFHNAPDAFLPEDFDVSFQKPSHRVPKLIQRLSNSADFVPSVTVPAVRGGYKGTGIRLQTTYNCTGTMKGSIRPVQAPEGDIELMDVPNLTPPSGDSTSTLVPECSAITTVKQIKIPVMSKCGDDDEPRSKSRCKEMPPKSGSENGSISKHSIKRFTRPRRVFFGLFG